jgi:hypothetical protein
MMKRRGAHPHSCHFVPRLEQLEERTVLNLAPVIVVNPAGNPVTVSYMEVGAYPLAPLAAADGAASFGAARTAISLFDFQVSTSALFLGRLTTSPAAQWLWEGPQPIFQPGPSPSTPWVWVGPEASSAPPKLAFSGLVDLHLDPAFAVLALPVRPTTPVAAAPPRPESYVTQVDHPADSPVSTVSTAAQSVAVLGVRGNHYDTSSLARVLWSSTYTIESPIVIREPRFEDQAVIITVGEVRAPDPDAQTHLLRYEYAAPSNLSDPTSDVLPFRSTIATASLVPPADGCIPAPVVSAPASQPVEILVDSDVRALPAPIGRAVSSDPAGRPDDQERRRDATWPAWAAAGTLFVVLYRRAVAAWRRRRAVSS